MLVGECAGCSRPVDRRYRFCPWCGIALRRKLTDFFLGLEGRALRVSRYLAEEERQVRLSIWNEAGEAEAAVSLEDDEAERLADFLDQTSISNASPWPPPEQMAASPSPPPCGRGAYPIF
jgi:hypothetical protein